MTTAAELRRARWAVAALFAVNGAFWSSVVPRLPEIKAGIGLSDAAYGAGVAAFSVGALGAGLAAGWLVARVGSGRLAVASAALSGALLVTPALAADWLTFAAAALALGALDSAMDVAMNAHGLRVQRVAGRSILHGMHAWWSIGAIVGGASGAIAAALGVPPGPHLLAAGIVLAAAALACRRGLLRDDEPTAARVRAEAVMLGALNGLGRARLLRAVALVGGLVVFAAVVEDAPGSWSGVLLREDLAVPAGLAGGAFVAFMVSMTVARLFADRLVDRFGPVAVVRAGGLLSAAALAAALAINEPWAVVAGFALVGLGAAPAFPAVFQAAEHLPGVSPATGVAAVSLIGRAGFLIAPLLIGALAEVASLRAALLVTVAAALLVAVAAPVLRSGPPGRAAPILPP